VELAMRVAQEGDLTKAEEILDQAEKLDASSHAARYARAEILIQRRRWDDALSILDGLARESPHGARVQFARGQALAGLGRIDEAEKALAEAARLAPSPGRAHYELGKIYERRGDKDRALREYRLAIEDLLKERHW
jgi:Flp pilus assembly protein TadD